MGLQLIEVININLLGLKAMPEKKGGCFALCYSRFSGFDDLCSGARYTMVWCHVALYLWSWPRAAVDYCGYIYSRSKKFTPLTKMESLYYLSKRWTINNVGFIFLRTYKLVIKAREQLTCTIAGGAEPFP